MAWNLAPEDVKSEVGLRVQTDQELAMKLMLPKESDKLKEHYVVCGYYTNKVLEEARYLMVKNYRAMRKHFKATADDYTLIMKTVGRSNT